MTAENLNIHLTYDDLATLDHALHDYANDLQQRAKPLDPQGQWDQTLLTLAHEAQVLRQKLDRGGYPVTGDPLEHLQAAHTAVTTTDARVSELVAHRRHAVVTALEAGYRQTDLADQLGVTQSRIAHMKNQ